MSLSCPLALYGQDMRQVYTHYAGRREEGGLYEERPRDVAGDELSTLPEESYDGNSIIIQYSTRYYSSRNVKFSVEINKSISRMELSFPGDAESP